MVVSTTLLAGDEQIRNPSYTNASNLKPSYHDFGCGIDGPTGRVVCTAFFVLLLEVSPAHQSGSSAGRLALRCMFYRGRRPSISAAVDSSVLCAQRPRLR